MEEFEALGIAVPYNDDRPFHVIDGMHLFNIRQAKRGTYPYSPLEHEAQAALAAQVYKVARMLTGATSINEDGLAAERSASEIVIAHLLLLDGVLRGQRPGQFDNWGANLYDQLRNDLGPPYVRRLFELPVNTAELEIGHGWFLDGVALGRRHPEMADVEHQIPEIVLELELLAAMVQLRVLAAQMAGGERAANAVDLNLEPVPAEAMRAIGASGAQRPDLLALSRIALNLNWDPSKLLPNLAFLRGHMQAAAAIGRFQRLGNFDHEPVGHWGLLGLVDPEHDQNLDDEMANARAYLRALVPVGLQHAIEREPAPIIAGFELEKLRKYQSEVRGDQ